MSKYEFTDDMAEISGIGGSYEDACRQMVVAGLEWWDANPKANPVSETLEGVYGLINPGNEDAKALEKVMLGAVPDCTGAMHHATTMAVLFIHANGWDEYARQMREAKARKVAG